MEYEYSKPCEGSQPCRSLPVRLIYNLLYLKVLYLTYRLQSPKVPSFHPPESVPLFKEHLSAPSSVDN